MEEFKDIILPVLAAFIICLFTGPFIIKAMQKLKFGQQVRDDGPKSHLSKQNTPTIGGLIILAGILVPALIFRLNGMAMIACLVAFAYGIVGFLDDFIKIVKKRSLGLKAYQKIIGQFGIALITALYAYYSPEIGSSIYLPFSGGEFDLGWAYIPVAIFVIIALVNASNLTDGLDGLDSGVSLIIMSTFTIIITYLSARAFSAGDSVYGEQLKMLATFCAIAAGAALGFLRFNIYPARIFMGDTGSFILGGALAAATLFSRLMLLIPIMGGVLVASCVSVILQVGSYKLRKKRVFLMAPLHHHFELKGYPETKVTGMYMIVTLVLCMLSPLMLG